MQATSRVCFSAEIRQVRPIFTPVHEVVIGICRHDSFQLPALNGKTMTQKYIEVRKPY